MSAHPTQPLPQQVPGQPAASTYAYIQVLHDFITMGTDLARLMHQQAIAHAQSSKPPNQDPEQPTPTPSPKPLITLTIAFDRIARSVRRSILLTRTLAIPIQPAPDPAQPRAAARRRILREVEDTIHRAANDAASPEADRTASLTAELQDRLDAPDLDEDVTTRPIPEIIAEICRDLGLAARPGTDPWKRRTPADIQRLCARAAASTPHPGANPPPTRTTPQHPTTPSQPEPPPINLRPIPQPPAGTHPLDDPAEAIATILRHPSLRTPPHPPPTS